MAKIGTLTTGVGVVSTFDMTYVPQFLFYVAATQLTGLKISVLGDGVTTDLDAAGLTAVGKAFQFGSVTNGYLIPIADGLIKGKNVEIVVTNSAAQTPVLYAVSQQYGSIYMQCVRSKALADSGAEFTKFAAICIPAIGATDILNISYVDGFTSKVESAELAAMAILQQNDAAAVINNLLGNIDRVQFTPAADRTVYSVRYSGSSLTQKSM